MTLDAPPNINRITEEALLRYLLTDAIRLLFVARTSNSCIVPWLPPDA